MVLKVTCPLTSVPFRVLVREITRLPPQVSTFENPRTNVCVVYQQRSGLIRVCDVHHVKTDAECVKLFLEAGGSVNGHDFGDNYEVCELQT